ncbi:MAG: FmdB family zinc ribbon protein [Candidatus Cryosericum sp.]
MPLYDLQCSACGTYTEAIQPMDQPQPTRCATCGKKKVHRVILKPVATYNNYSPMHPRKNRGTGIGRKR